MSHEQEQVLVAAIHLLLVAVCVRKHLTFNDIIASYNISHRECIRYLAKLED